MKYKLLTWAVLVMVPFTGVRVVCVDAPADVSVPADDQLEGHFCRETCARPKVAPSGSNCVLSADAASLLLVESLAILPAQAPIRAQNVTVRIEAELPDFYLAPALSRRSPPPKL